MPRPAAAVPAEPAAAAAPDFSLAGDEDRDYLLELENALEAINDHFHNLVGEEPHGITSSETGCQRAFDNDVYQQAVADGTSAYTAGGSLSWLDLRWSSAGCRCACQWRSVCQTPCSRRRDSTLERCTLRWRKATTLSTIGGWMHGVDPEEIPHDMVFVAAGAVRLDAGNANLLNAWKRCLLSTTFTFKVLATAEQRVVWYALQQREIVPVRLVAGRSCFQRCHEVARARQMLAENERGGDFADGL